MACLVRNMLYCSQGNSRVIVECPLFLYDKTETAYSQNKCILGYNEYRKFCGLQRARTFDDFKAEIRDERVLRMLQKIYRHPDDVDLFAGGISESSMAEGVIGPTFGCIIADTFSHARRGDRFWFERDHVGGFTPSEFIHITRTELKEIIIALIILLNFTLIRDRNLHESCYTCVMG